MAAGDERISQLALLAGAQAVATDLTVVVDTSASQTKRMTLEGLAQAVLNLAPNGSISLLKLDADGADKLSGNAISLASLPADRIVSNSLTADQIAPNAIGSSELADSAVDTAALQSLSVTEAKLADASVSARTLQSSSVTANAIGIGEVLYNRLQSSASGNVLLGVTSTGSGTYTEIPCTPYVRTLFAAETATAAQALLNLGPLATATGTWAEGSSFSGTSSGTNTGDQTITLTGAVTGSGTGSFATTLAANVVAEANLANGAVSSRTLVAKAVGALALGDNSCAVVSTVSPSGTGAFIGQSHFNPTTATHYVWDGTLWTQTSGITAVATPANNLLTPEVVFNTAYDITLNLNPTPQLPNLVWIGPESGGSAAPTFRALAAADLPPASSLARGAVRTGEGLSADNDGLTTLTAATTTTKGGVSVPGPILTVDGNGALTHAPSPLAAGTYTKVITNSSGHIVGAQSLDASDIPSLPASVLTSGTLSVSLFGNKSIVREKLADYAVGYIQEADPGASDNPPISSLWFRESTAQLHMWNGNSWFPVGFGRLSEENLRYCGTFRADTGTITGLTLLGINESFSIGQAVPTATDARAGVYLVCDTSGSGVGVLTGTTFDPGDWILCNGSLGGWVRIDSALGGGSGSTEFLTDLLDVEIVTPNTGDLLAYSAGGIWESADPPIVNTAITAGGTPAGGQLLADQLLISNTDTDPALFMKLANGTVVRIAGSGAIGAAADASDTVKGIVELATNAETLTGTDALRAVVPAGLKHVLDSRPATESGTGLIELATLAETSAGTDTVRAVTPAGIKPLLDAKFTTADSSETVKGIIELATLAETAVGTDTVRAVTPAGIKPLLDAKFTTAAASETVSGIIELATTSEVNTGTDAVRAVTPATLAARTSTDARAGLIELATQAEVDTGTDAVRAVTPATLLSRLDSRFGSIASYAKGALLAGASSSALGVLAAGTDGFILEADAASALGVRWVAKPGGITSVSGVAPISVANPSTAPEISVASASTSVAGVVQLSTATNSTSTSLAATPSAVKAAYDLAAAALPSAGGTLTGDLGNTSTGFLRLPSGTTAQRPVSPLTGAARFNSSLTVAEVWDGSAWQGLAKLDSPTFTGNPTAPTPAAQDNDTSIATTAFVQSALIQSGPLAGFRNAIINGNFDVWQRGTSFTTLTTDSFFADHWCAQDNETLGSRVISRQDFDEGQTDVLGEPRHFIRIDQTTATTTSGSFYFFGQKIEDVRTFAGQQVTLSLWVRAATGSITMPTNPIYRFQDFGAGGSAQTGGSQGPLTSGSTTVTTAWQKWVFTETVPSISGKTIDDTDANFLFYGINLPRGSTFTLDTAQWQLELGPVAMPFERRPIGVELALCQRYYEKSYIQSCVPGSGYLGSGAPIESGNTYDSAVVGASGVVGNTNDRYFATRYKVTKRANPTITLYDTGNGTAGAVTLYNSDYSTAEVRSGSAVSTVNRGDSGFTVKVTTTNSSRFFLEYQYTSEAEL